MSNEPAPQGVMEELVRQTLIGAYVSRDVWEARWDGEPPEISDAQLSFENFFELIRRQGLLTAQLAFFERTREELSTSLPNAIHRMPVRLRMSVHGHAKTSPEELFRDIAELLGVHRKAILRVIEEQVDEGEEIKDLLEEAQVPDRDDDDPVPSVGRVVLAHSRALILIAADIDAWVVEVEAGEEE
jgi:hypothetical protein